MHLLKICHHIEGNIEAIQSNLSLQDSMMLAFWHVYPNLIVHDYTSKNYTTGLIACDKGSITIYTHIYIYMCVIGYIGVQCYNNT